MSIKLKYWSLSSSIGERIALALPGSPQLTAKNKIEKNAERYKKLIEGWKDFYFVCG